MTISSFFRKVVQNLSRNTFPHKHEVIFLLSVTALLVLSLSPVSYGRAAGTLAIDNSGTAHCSTSLTGSGTISCGFTTTSSNDVILVFVSSNTGTASTPIA